MSAASAAAAAAAAANTAAAQRNRRNKTISTWETHNTSIHRHHHHHTPPPLNRYETQKRQDWNTFWQYLYHHHTPPLDLPQITGAHVIEFLEQFVNTKVHNENCTSMSGCSDDSAPSSSCTCPRRQTPWASLNGIIGRLFVAYGDNGGRAEKNPFDERVVQLYLLEVKESEAKARGKKPHERMGGRPP